MHKVSIVIATYNEQAHIETVLLSCKNQNYKDIEIVVIDSTRSTDQTSAIAAKYARTYTYGSERSVQRNYGVRQAKGEYVLLLDADMRLTPTVVQECVLAMGDGRVRGVVVPEKSFGTSYWAKCKALERNCYLGDPSIQAARFFRRKDFIKLGGYNPHMISGEDWDLSKRFTKLGPIAQATSYILHNEGSLSLLKDLKKKYYYSLESGEYIKTNVAGTKDVLLYIFRPAYFKNWKMLLSDPIHFPGFVVMKFLELTIGGFAIIKKPEFWKALKNEKYH